MDDLSKRFKQHTGLEFKEFYLAHKPKLVWHLAKMTKDLGIAEDYAEEAFIQALHKIETFNVSKAQVHTWVYTIAENFCKKGFRENQKLPSVSMDKELAVNLTLSTFLQYHDGKKDIEKQNEINRKAEIVKEAINSLPEKYKEVMVMRELQHMQYKDISDALEINLSTIKSQIKKGRDIVRKKVERKFKFIDENGLPKNIIN
jgi:RNA polymerase sigma-70 factor (ECF subfamily)